MDVVFLALVAGVAFAGVNVAIQMGFARYPDIELGGVTAALIAIVMASIVAVATRIDLSDVGFNDVWPFLAIGIFVPGASQILYVHGIRHARPSRSGIVIGTPPCWHPCSHSPFLTNRSAFRSQSAHRSDSRPVCTTCGPYRPIFGFEMFFFSN